MFVVWTIFLPRFSLIPHFYFFLILSDVPISLFIWHKQAESKESPLKCSCIQTSQINIDTSNLKSIQISVPTTSFSLSKHCKLPSYLQCCFTRLYKRPIKRLAHPINGITSNQVSKKLAAKNNWSILFCFIKIGLLIFLPMFSFLSCLLHLLLIKVYSKNFHWTFIPFIQQTFIKPSLWKMHPPNPACHVPSQFLISLKLLCRYPQVESHCCRA